MNAPELISLDDFFGPPARTGASISPDGNRIAFLAPWKNRLNVWVQDVDGNDDARCVTADDVRSVLDYHWTDNPRWLLYLQDSGGDENHHVFRVDLDDPDADAVDLTPFPGSRVYALERSREKEGVVTLLMNARDLAAFDLYELEIATGELTMIGESPGPGQSWTPGVGGDLLLFEMTAQGGMNVARRKKGSDVVKHVTTFEGADYPMGVGVIHPTADGTGLWVASTTDSDLTRLNRVDLDTGEETVVDSHPTLELDAARRAVEQVESPLIFDKAGELIGARYLGERQVIHTFDSEFAEVVKNLNALSDGDIGALSSDDSGRKWVVAFTHDRDPGVTYYYDHTTGESRKLFRPYPHLNPDDMAPMTPVTITARDGLELPSYLTLPVGVEPVGLPMILLVHGGPWYRDAWRYVPIVQFLANRGYAVLQVNFRGSTGYGKAHTKAAIGEFAGKMHDDLIDGVEWAVAQGYADRDRVAIMGGSYGGYAALVGAAFTPDVFAASVDYVGISDLANFMRTQPAFARPGLVNNWYLYVGDPAIPEQEADMLARSPITRLDDITTPLLIAQGANDARVVKAESDNVVERLRARGVDIDYIVYDDEGHGFVNPENSIGFYREVERFLAEHLGGHRV
ncbi:S9 family peptidase [Rhodococcus sp. BP-252]|uniref:alpha/beta hydrolase family protein n=1 Tax=unclassified Rhodococcus (in: high G+C Gram-positive bacteria) TaxID=192944 RepID=UPI001C9B48C6|nr:MULTISPECIES: S9 family peptidase [unclassified Rhodococcus (in: high G+C Gram-positive bacteria)]MBY6414838.1 S9 family peptidase [Rhodococcus sp. BP-320]MBY6419757.1 S9 family peptidase [Rhodococcus sp. BP-321]MBY6423150.1 S9 family peptidase [Rhodococcus sp. BP-324]MBY6429716.1 S9 family peptidase [Rhodococcus sp. BP-323]MBY6434688.1 S9 family peptidase [Rhodococcus sp. BP-322]